MRMSQSNYNKQHQAQVHSPLLLEQKDQDKIRQMNSPKEEPAFHFTYRGKNFMEQ
mgnify:CR=1 FL=1